MKAPELCKEDLPQLRPDAAKIIFSNYLRKENTDKTLSKSTLKKKKFTFVAAAAAKSHQSYPTLCDPIDGSPPGSPVPGILQARTLEWVAISFSNAGK